VGKRIQLDKGVFDFSFFTIRVNRGRGFEVDVDNEWHDIEQWSPDQEYVMTDSDGLVPAEQLDPEALKRGVYQKDPSRHFEVFPKQRIREGIRQKMDSVERVMDSLQELLHHKARPAVEETEEGGRAVANPFPGALDPSTHILSRLF
jgi:hypothetical protein